MPSSARSPGKSGASSLMQPGPVPISFLYVLGDRLRPSLLHALAVVEIEFALDDRPCFRIDGCGVALAHAVGTVTAVLRGVLFRVACEFIAVLRTSEPPR